MPASSKRKKSTPLSSRAKSKTRKGGRKGTPSPPLLWGAKIEDLRLVQISVNVPLFTQSRDLYQYFRDVSYTEHKTGEQIAADIESRMSSLVIEESLKTDLNHKLKPLIQKLKPLENITTYQQHDIHHNIRWDWKDLETPQMDLLCKNFSIALRNSMADTDGKHAMRALLEEIVTLLDRRPTLEVIATGSPKATRYACLVKMEYVKVPSPISSSSLEEYKDEYVNYNVPRKAEKSPLSLRSSVQKKSPEPTGSGSSTDEQEPPKRRTSDVLVFSDKDYEPIVSHLVVSVKSGSVVDPRGIAQELLGRLPYQSGIIYGLEINQVQAGLYSVEKRDGGSGPIVKLLSYPAYFFQKENEFNFPSFKKMVLDIGFILMVNQDRP